MAIPCYELIAILIALLTAVEDVSAEDSQNHRTQGELMRIGNDRIGVLTRKILTVLPLLSSPPHLRAE